MPKLASQMRAAFPSMAWNTGSSSPGELRDDLQHLRGRGLLLQRLGKLARARLHLVEQPHILDRDHRLVGEGRDQLDLLVGERPTFCAIASITPIGDPSRSSGTPSTVRIRRRDWRRRDNVIPRSATTSSDVNGLAFEHVRPTADPRPP